MCADLAGMRIVAVSRLRPGMRLGRAVYSCVRGVRMPLWPFALYRAALAASVWRHGRR